MNLKPLLVSLVITGAGCAPEPPGEQPAADEPSSPPSRDQHAESMRDFMALGERIARNSRTVDPPAAPPPNPDAPADAPDPHAEAMRSLMPWAYAPDEPATANPRTIDEIRADATMAMNEVEALHDEIIRLLEARIVVAQGDAAATKSANDALTLAQLAKRQDMDGLRGDVAADAQWRIEGALSKAAIIRDQLQAQIADLQE